MSFSRGSSPRLSLIKITSPGWRSRKKGLGLIATIEVGFSFPHSCPLFFPKQDFHAPSSWPESLTSGPHPGLHFPVLKLLRLQSSSCTLTTPGRITETA